MPQFQGMAMINVGYFTSLQAHINSVEASFTAGARTILAEAHLPQMLALGGIRMRTAAVSAGIDLGALSTSTDIPFVTDALTELSGALGEGMDAITGVIDGITNDIQQLLNDAQAAIQEMVDTVMADIQGALDGIRVEIAKMTPLAVIPTDLGSVITWISHMADPYIQTIIKLNAQISQVVGQVTAIQATLTSALSRMPHITISIPIVV